MTLAYILMPGVQRAALGHLPDFLNAKDPRPAREQFNAHYRFGGWQPMQGFRLSSGDPPRLLYPGDPPQHAIAFTWLRKERIIFYPHAFVLIMQADKSFEVARMD
jgi:hypothetical protein